MTEPRTPEENLAALGIELPQPPSPGGNYVSAKRAGQVIYLSGVISTDAGGVITGTAGADRTIEDGYAAAQAARSRNSPFCDGNSVRSIAWPRC